MFAWMRTQFAMSAELGGPDMGPMIAAVAVISAIFATGMIVLHAYGSSCGWFRRAWPPSSASASLDARRGHLVFHAAARGCAARPSKRHAWRGAAPQSSSSPSTTLRCIAKR